MFSVVSLVFSERTVVVSFLFLASSRRFTLPSLSLHPSVCVCVCFHLVFAGQRFEGFRNDKAMPQSLEPSCSSAADEGPVATNHLRSVSGDSSSSFPPRPLLYNPPPHTHTHAHHAPSTSHPLLLLSSADKLPLMNWSRLILNLRPPPLECRALLPKRRFPAILPSLTRSLPPSLAASPARRRDAKQPLWLAEVAGCAL